MTPEAVKHADRDHYIFGGSGAERNYQCRGSVGMGLGHPDPEPSKQAEEGTIFHELIDTCGKVLCYHYNKGNGLIPIKELLNFPTVDNWPSVMQSHAKTWFEKLYERIEADKPKKIFSERKIQFDVSNWTTKQIEIYGGIGGPADFLYAYEKDGEYHLFVADAKYGAGYLVEVTSLQILLYMCAAADQFRNYDFATATGIIFQPRLEDDDGETWREMVYSGEDVYAWIDKIQNAAEHSIRIAEDGTFREHLKVGDWCGFCKAKGHCDAYISAHNEDSEIDIEEVAEAREVAIKNNHGPDDVARGLLTKLDTPEKMSRWLKFIPILRAMIAHSQGMAIVQILEGTEIPDFKVVEGRSQRRFPKGKDAVTAEALKGLGIEEPFGKKLKGIGEIERELKSSGIKSPKKAIEHLVVRSIPGKNLVSTSDLRLAIDGDSDAVGDFADIEIE